MPKNKSKIDLEILKEKVLDLIGLGDETANIKKTIGDLTGFKKTKCNEIYNEILSSADLNSEIFDLDFPVEGQKKPYYNSLTNKYIVYIPYLSRNIVISKEKHDAILAGYSDWDGDGKSLNDICRTHAIPRPILTQYLKAFNITHDSLPISEEDLAAHDDEELTERLHELRKFSLLQKFEKESWAATQKDAVKWREFQNGTLNPFEKTLERWKPKDNKLTPYQEISPDSKTILIGLSDLHFGAAAKARYMYAKEEWTTEMTKKVVKNYCYALLQSMSERKYTFDKIVVCFLGDFIHSMSGKTGRGTELKYDCVREEQFEAALDTLVYFIDQLLVNFKNIEVHSVCGNHFYDSDSALYRTIQATYRNNRKIAFNNYSTRPASFLTGSTLVLLDHGQDASERAYVPTKEAGIKSHVNSLLVKKPKLLEKAKTTLFIQGNFHTFKHIEFDNFEFIQFSTSLGSDEHASVNNWGNRGRQSSLILDENGLKEVLHFYSEELLKR